MPAIVPPPPAPAAAPAAKAAISAPKPATAPQPKATAPAPESNDPFQDAFADIDQLDSGKKPAPKKEADNKLPPSKGGAEDQESDTTGNTALEEQSATNADGSLKEKESESPHGEQKPLKVKELRDAYEGLKEKVKKEYEPKARRVAELEARVKEFESRDETSTKATQERMAAIEKRNVELENHIRFVDYEKSKDYQDQFQKPYEEAWSNALRELKGLTIKIEDPNTGEEKVREVTQADIAYFAQLDPAARRTEINRLFPEDKEEVKRHINQISYLAEKAQQAKEKAKSDAETHAKTQSEQFEQAQKNRVKLWQESNKVLAEKYPQWFAKSEDDQEGNQIFDKGTALADLVFNTSDLTPERVAILPKAFRQQIEANKPFTQDQMVRLHAIIRNKAANHDRLAHQNKLKDARIAELEKSLKEFEDSGPDKVPAGGASRTQPNGITDFNAELEALDRKFA